MRYGTDGSGQETAWLSYAEALERARRTGAVTRQAEGAFVRSLPPGASVQAGAAGLPPGREIHDRREAFRRAHAQMCRFRRQAGECEEELFPFAEDRR